jgi:hypothetical protein
MPWVNSIRGGPMVIATHMIGRASAFLALCCAGLGAGAFVAALLTAGLVDQTRLRAQGKIQRDDTAARNAVLWRDPGAIGGKNLSWSSDPQLVQPAPPFRFIEEDTGGTRPKVEVTDAKGTRWNVKLSGGTADTGEVHAEVAATRLAWALGYLVEEVQYVREGKIGGLGQLKRAGASIAPDGTFKVARFEKRPADVIRTGNRWTFDKNPFGHQDHEAGKSFVPMVFCVPGRSQLLNMVLEKIVELEATVLSKSVSE